MAEKKNKKPVDDLTTPELLPRIWEKPVIVKNEKMTFPMDIIEKFNGGRFCVQCSGCHGCR